MYSDVTLMEESSTKGTPVISTITSRQADINLAAVIDGSKEVTMTQ
jgi:hypothetical protein